MRKNEKMNTKNILVSFLLIASVLFLATAVSAADITTNPTIKVEGIEVITAGTLTGTDVSVNAGETITVKVIFEADVNGSDVRIKATIEGNKDDVTAVTSKFDVIDGNTYVKTLTLKVPSDIEADELDDAMPLTIKIWNSDDESETSDIDLTVQRASYDLAIKSVNADNTINAGKTMPVEVVLKNVGYNNADDVYITVSIPELNIVKSGYLGDLVTENYKDSTASDDEDKTTISAKLNLDVPYSAKAGIYTLVVEAKNDETTSTDKQEITITNSVSDIAMKSGNNLVLLNPTSNLVVYKVVYNSNEQVVVVSAASSQTVPIETSTDADVLIYNASGETLLSTVKFSGSNQSVAQLTSPVFILTVVLAIVFLVLLVVLVVLITKKPQKAEEFGESYY